MIIFLRMHHISNCYVEWNARFQLHSNGLWKTSQLTDLIQLENSRMSCLKHTQQSLINRMWMTLWILIQFLFLLLMFVEFIRVVGFFSFSVESLLMVVTPSNVQAFLVFGKEYANNKVATSQQFWKHELTSDRLKKNVRV